MRVMNAMSNDPVDGATFKRKRSEKGQNIFDYLWGFEAAMRQESVKAHTHSQARGHPPEHNRDHEGLPLEGEKRSHCANMKERHEHRRVPADTPAFRCDGFLLHSIP